MVEHERGSVGASGITPSGESYDPPVTKLMRTDFPTVTPDDTIATVARKLAESGLQAIPVMENGTLVGIISEMDLVAREAEVEVPTVVPFLDALIQADAGRRFDDEVRQALATTAGELMTPRVVTIRPDATLTQVATVMVERDINTLPVVDYDDQVIGMVSRSDLVRMIARLENAG